MIGTTIILEDQSDIPSLQISDNTTRPVVFSAFTSDSNMARSLSNAMANLYFKLLTLSTMAVSCMQNV